MGLLKQCNLFGSEDLKRVTQIDFSTCELILDHPIVKCYLLYRNSGFLVFNDCNEPEKYWLAFQGQYHGSPEIIKEITSIEFRQLVSGGLEISELSSRYPECSGDAEASKKADFKHNLSEIMGLHKLHLYSWASQNFISRITKFV